MKYIIIGCGVGGVTAARALLKADQNAEILLFDRERYPYYPRPRLWEFIAGKTQAVEDIFFQPEAWYAQQGIELRLETEVTRVETGQHQIELANGEKVSYDRLLLAIGARPFKPPVEGADHEGVFTLRNFEDASRIAAFSDNIDHAIIIGGGLLGLETSYSLKMRKCKTTIIEFAPYLLPRQLDEQGSNVLRSYLENLGLEIITGAASERITRKNGSLTLHFKDGRSSTGELVLFSTGIRSRIELPGDSGLETNHGILVNDYLETSAQDVYAAGDIAEHNGIVYGIIPAAMEQARIAASNMAAPQSAAYSGTVPSNRLKVVGLDVNSIGDAAGGADDITALRWTDLDTNSYRRINLKDGKIVGAIVIGESNIVQPIKQLIAAGKDVSAYKGRLLDPDFDFKTLLVEG